MAVETIEMPAPQVPELTPAEFGVVCFLLELARDGKLTSQFTTLAENNVAGSALAKFRSALR